MLRLWVTKSRRKEINKDKIETERVKREQLQIKFLSKIQTNPRNAKGIFMCVMLSLKFFF